MAVADDDLFRHRSAGGAEPVLPLVVGVGFNGRRAGLEVVDPGEPGGVGGAPLGCSDTPVCGFRESGSLPIRGPCHVDVVEVPAAVSGSRCVMNRRTK
jgi:hypothetical protein